MIKEKTIEEVLNVSIIEEVIGEFVDLKRAGTSWKGCSPFTNEKSPSFFVVPSKNIFKCFSSGKGGSLIKFLMEYKKLSFPETIHFLADKYGIHVEEDNAEQSEETKSKKQTADALIRATQNKFIEQREDPIFMEQMKSRGFGKEEITEWGLGFAPGGWQFLTKKIIATGHYNVGEELGLVKTTKGKNFDVYRYRITVPIEDQKGRIIGFAGRDTSGEKGVPKYINPKESFFYSKSKLLFGWLRAQESIQDKGKAYLVEGYFDVISMHRMGVPECIAPCGTAITYDQIKYLRRFTKHIVLVMDGDNAGMRSMLKYMDEFLREGFKVEICVLPDDHDPDSFSRECKTPKAFRKQLEESTSDAVFFKAKKLFEGKKDPDALQESFDQITATLTAIRQIMKRDAYLKEIASLYKLKMQDLRKGIIGHEKIASDNVELPPDAMKLPAGVDRDEWEEFGFYEQDGGYWFSSNSGKSFRGTNFIMEPCFHVYSDSDIGSDNKRLIKIKNKFKELIIEMPSSATVSFAEFKRVLVQKGNFMFVGTTANHFDLLMVWLNDQFITCEELVTLGWRPEGFFAMANGLIIGDEFHEVDELGITTVNTSKEVDGKLVENIKNYYSPAFSRIFTDTNPDFDKYENDRNFIFRETDLDFSTWMKMMDQTYGYKGRIGVAFAIASMFRDIYMKAFQFFPHLFAYGTKSSGKSVYCASINNLFYTGLGPFDLNSGSQPGFYRRLARVRNTVNWCDEYHDKIDGDRFQGLKGGYNDLGREIGTLSGKHRTDKSHVNSALLISGQYRPAIDDGSLNSRSVELEFIKEEHSKEITQAFDKLKEFETKGISGITLEVLRHREYMEKNLIDAFGTVKKELSQSLEGRIKEVRILGNFTALLTPLVLLHKIKAFKIPFDMGSFTLEVIEHIEQSTIMVRQSDGLADFWRIFSNLIDDGALTLENDYDFTNKDFVSIRKDGGIVKYNNQKGDDMLMIRFARVYGAYSKEIKNQKSEKAIDNSTMEGYFKGKDYFIGMCPQHKFSRTRTSAFVFNYTMLEQLDVVLKRGDLVGEESSYLKYTMDQLKDELTKRMNAQDFEECVKIREAMKELDKKMVQKDIAF